MGNIIHIKFICTLAVFNFFRIFIVILHHKTSITNTLIPNILTIIFTPKTHLKGTKFVRNLPFFYERPMDTVTFKYPTYEEKVTICNLWHNFSGGWFKQ